MTVSAMAVGSLWLINAVLWNEGSTYGGLRLLVDFLFLTTVITLFRWKTAFTA
jgi:hypothetical protein